MSSSILRGSPARWRGAAWRPLVVSIAGAAHLLSGCMSMSPNAERAVPLPNGIIEYRNPTFDNRVTWLGWTFVGAMTAGGAYEGYRSNMPLRWQGWERGPETKPGGNIAIGALTGLASGLLLTYLLGGSSEPVTTDNAEKWLDRYNDRMALIPTDAMYPGLAVTSIRAIARNADAAYVVRSIDDARFFLATFPESPYRDATLAEFARAAKRDSLLPFAAVARGFPAGELAINRWVEGIGTFDEAVTAAGTLGSNRPAIGRRASELVTDMQDLRRFTMAFPGSPFTEPLAIRMSTRIAREEIPRFLDLFPSARNREDLMRRYLNGSRSTEEAIEAMRNYPELKEDVERRAASLAQSVDDYQAYIAAFPGGPHAAEMRRRIDEARRAERETNSWDDDGSAVDQ